jgi:hypothetical protein
MYGLFYSDHVLHVETQVNFGHGRFILKEIEGCKITISINKINIKLTSTKRGLSRAPYIKNSNK